MNKDEAIKYLSEFILFKKISNITEEEAIECFKLAIEALQQQPSEDEQIIKVRKGTLKARTGRYVIYDVEWLKTHFNTNEAKIYGQPQSEERTETHACDYISRQAVLELVADYDLSMGQVVKGIHNLPPVTPQPKTEWIPVKWHNITDEERKREGYPKEWLTMLDCPMPNDDEEILVTVKSVKCGLHVEKDVCYIDDGFSLDSGHDWIDDVIAWMPLPHPFEPQESEVGK